MNDTPSPLDELERLKEEWQKSVHEMRCQPNSGINQLALAAAEKDFGNALFRHSLYLIAAAREAETLREDAERYRWLREWCDINFDDDGTFSDLENSYGTPNPKTEFTARLQAKLDAAIDAARKGQGE